jgi:hypothetical protein
MTKRIKTVLALALFASMAVATSTMTGCREQGPAEKVGERIDDAGEAVKDAFEEATD